MSDQAWIDNQGDVWRLGDDGLMHTPETAPFPREYVEKKWGPLKPVPRPRGGFSEEFEHIKAAIYDNPRSDPGRLEACLSIALEALGEMACTDYLYRPRTRAQEALKRMEMRVRLGDDQPAGEHITYPYEDVLDADERGGW